MKQTGPTNYTFTFAGTAMTYHEDKDGRFVMDAEEHARLQVRWQHGEGAAAGTRWLPRR